MGIEMDEKEAFNKDWLAFNRGASFRGTPRSKAAHKQELEEVRKKFLGRPPRPQKKVDAFSFTQKPTQTKKLNLSNVG